MSASDFVREHEHRIEKAARAGYVARGTVFVVIGYFAAKAAYSTGQTMSSKDAITFVFGSAGGALLLAVLVLALFAFAAWRVFQALKDPDGHGTDAKGLVVRAGLLGSAGSYGALAVFAGFLAAGLHFSSGNGDTRRTVVAYAYEAGFGLALTYLIAAVLIGVGVAHIVKGATAGFMKYLRMPADKERWLKPVCQFGLVARGVTFLILAWLVFTGAASYQAGEAPGLEAALDAMSAWRWGWLALAVTGFGLMAFGAYAFVEARYRRIDLDMATQR